MASTTATGVTVGGATIVACSVARLTETCSIPGTARIAFSTRATHDAQVMPVMPTLKRRGSAVLRVSALDGISAERDASTDIFASVFMCRSDMGLPIMGRSRANRPDAVIGGRQ